MQPSCKLTYLVDMHVQCRQDSIWVALPPIALHGGTHQRLGQDQVCKIMSVQEFRIHLEELSGEPFEGEIVYVRVWVEKVKIDVDETLLSPVGELRRTPM